MTLPSIAETRAAVDARLAQEQEALVAQASPEPSASSAHGLQVPPGIVLALFVKARRIHAHAARGEPALTKLALAQCLSIQPRDVTLAEANKPLDGTPLLRLLDWTGLKGTWVSGALCEAANQRNTKAMESGGMGAC